MQKVFSGDTVRGTVLPAWAATPLDTATLPDGVHEFAADGKFHYLHIANHADPTPEELTRWRNLWEQAIGVPDNYDYAPECVKVRCFSRPEYDAELFRQANGPGTAQPLLLLLPKVGKPPFPVVAIPFYHTSLIIGINPETGAKETRPNPDPDHWTLGKKLAERGFAVLSADSYHLTYTPLNLPVEDFRRWQLASEALLRDHPRWSGVGKLISDTKRMLDYAESDPRLDAGRIALMGHSLGGKMAFYTGCCDRRVKAVVASDWGIGWNQTNWADNWYWGKKLPGMINSGLEHSQLLALAAPLALLILGGLFDNTGANAFLARTDRIYHAPERLRLIDHGQGHLIPPSVFDAAVEFIRKFV